MPPLPRLRRLAETVGFCASPFGEKVGLGQFSVRLIRLPLSAVIPPTLNTHPVITSSLQS